MIAQQRDRRGSGGERSAADRARDKAKEKEKEKEKAELQTLGAETLQIIEQSEKLAQSKSVSFLSAEAVRWINKRQPTSSAVAHARVLPARALQLREIFQGLDFDNSGSIDISELKEAIEYVVRNKKSGDAPILKDPQRLAEFFVSMDTNNDGTVDFNEFLIAMTTQGSDDDGEQTNRLREGFFEFANHHQRQKVLDFVDNPAYSDLDKYQEMKELFKIQYFRDEQLDLSTAEKLLRAKQQAQKQMKEIRTKAYLQQKHLELVRAREAIMFFKDDKRNGLPTISRPFIPHLLDKELTVGEIALGKAEKEIRQKFSNYALHAEKTFTPDGRDIKGSHVPEESVRMRAKSEAAKVKTDKFLLKNLPPIAPPVSIRSKAFTPH